MEWWYYGPIILAIVMFLLIGTICERRIEASIRQIIDRRRALLPLNQVSEPVDATSSTTNLPTNRPTSKSATTLKSTSQRTLKACKTDTSIISAEKKLETASAIQVYRLHSVIASEKACSM